MGAPASIRPIRAVLLGPVALFVLLGAVAACGSEKGPIPSSWTKTAETGEIASVCLGSYLECGSIERTYLTGTSPSTAAAELEEAASSAGWQVRNTSVPVQDGVQMQLTSEGGDRSISVALNGDRAETVEVRR